MKQFSLMLVFSMLFVSTTIGLKTTQQEDPAELLEYCFRLCEYQYQGSDESELLECQERCRKYVKQQGGGSRFVGKEKEDDENPYVFEEKHFSAVTKNEHGEVGVIQKFNHAVLKGIQNFRLSVLVANPRAFFLPDHWDAETVAFVAEGKGSISLVRSEKRESLNIRCGDIPRIPSGTTV